MYIGFLYIVIYGKTNITENDESSSDCPSPIITEAVVQLPRLLDRQSPGFLQFNIAESLPGLSIHR